MQSASSFALPNRSDVDVALRGVILISGARRQRLSGRPFDAHQGGRSDGVVNLVRLKPSRRS
jgi:hypothetical protein